MNNALRAAKGAEREETELVHDRDEPFVSSPSAGELGRI